MGKKYRIERRTIDPRTVHVVLHDPAAVDYYEDNPHGTYGGFLAGNGGRPSVGRGAGGKLVAWEGNHRIAAAARAGRRISVDYQVEVGAAEDKPRGFFAGLFS